MPRDRLHAAVLPSSGAGHINPMLELCHQFLVPCELEVSFLVPNSSPYAPTENDEETLRLVLYSMPQCPIPNNNMLMSSEMLAVVRPVVEALQPPAQVLISSAFMGWSQDLANSLGIPRIALWPSNAATEVTGSCIHQLVNEGYLPGGHQGADDQKIITFIPGLPALRPDQLPVCYHHDTIDRQMQAAALARLPEAACVLVNTIAELEQEVVTKSQQERFRWYIPVGPLITSSINKRYEKDAEKCLQWLDRQASQSVLYIAFGSTFSPAAKEVEQIIEAVEQTRQPVLWAMRRNDELGGDFRERMASRAVACGGMVVEWAPQLLVLRHPSVAGFFTHCGWSSTMEAVIAGVPTICWPLAAEQNWNAMVMAEVWKIGINLVAHGPKNEKKLATTQSIARAIRDLMNGEQDHSMRQRVAALRKIACAALEQRDKQSICSLILQSIATGY